MMQLFIKFLEKRNIDFIKGDDNLIIRSSSKKRLGQVLDRLNRDGLTYSNKEGAIHVQF